MEFLKVKTDEKGVSGATEDAEKIEIAAKAFPQRLKSL